MINLITLGILFILAFLASLGAPGALVWMLYSGALANSFLELIPVILTTAAAAILGDIVAYELAKRFSLALPSRLMKFKFYKSSEIKARELFQKSGFFVVFLTRFAFTGLGAVVNYISGFEKIKRKKFLIAVVSGEIIYGIIYPLMGFIFKETWNDLVNVIGDIIVILVSIIIAMFLVAAYMKKRKKIVRKF